MEDIKYDEIFDTFKSCYIGKEIKKDVILEKITNKEDKEIINRFVDDVYIKYSVKAEKINKTAEINFEEIQIIEIDINDYRAIYDIYGILLTIIPYPILAIFRYNDRVSFAVSNRILDENKNNKGKIYTSYLIREEEITDYLKIDITECQTMIDIYNKWISNIEKVSSYYERLDTIIDIIEIGFHIKSSEVLEKLESYIARDCGTYNMKPKDGWNSKLDKYLDNKPFVKKVETHILWEYLTENTFLKNRLEDFTSWDEFKESVLCSNRMNEIYYSQYNSIMSDDDEFDDVYENKRKNIRYRNVNKNIKVELIKSESRQVNNIDEIVQEIVGNVKEKGIITFKDLSKILAEKFGKPNKKIIIKILSALNDNNIEVLDEEDENAKVEFNEYQKQLLETIENEPTALENADYETKDNFDFMLAAVKIDNLCLLYASDRLKNDKEFMLRTIKEDGLNIDKASDELKDNENFILDATKIDNMCLDFASDRLKNDSDFMLLINEIDGRSLAYASDELKNNREFILKAAKKSIWALAFATDDIRDDKEFVSKIVEVNSWTLKHASDRLKNDKEIVLKAIKNDGWFLAYASDKLRNDREFLIEAIHENEECLAFADDNLKKEILEEFDEDNNLTYEQKDNEEYMLKLIKNDYFDIRLASDRLKNDSDFILKAMKKGDSAFKCLAFASDGLRANKDFILKVFKKNGSYIFPLVSESLKSDREFILKILKLDYLCFAYIDFKLRTEKEFMMKAISINAETYEFASYELRNDKEFALQAIAKNPLSFPYVSDELKNDKDFTLQAIDISFFVIEYIKTKFRNDKDIVLAFLKHDKFGDSLRFASNELRNDNEFMLQITDLNVRALKNASDRLKNDKEFMLQAFEKNNNSLEFASDRLKNDSDFMSKIKEKNNNSIYIEFEFVYKDDFLDRYENYGLVGCLEGYGISVLEKDEFCMKIVNRETGKIVECNHTPLYLLNEVLEEEENAGSEYFIADWKFRISDVNDDKLKNFDSYMRRIRMAYCIYRNDRSNKNIIIENKSDDIDFQYEKNPLYQYIHCYSDIFNDVSLIESYEDYSIIELCDIQPEVMMAVSNVLQLLEDKSDIQIVDYIAMLPTRHALGDSWHYAMENNIEYVYLLGINISNISKNIIREVEDNLKKFGVKYNIEGKIDDAILTMYPTEVEHINCIIRILDSNDIEYEVCDYTDELDNIKNAQTCLYMFDLTIEEKEKIRGFLNEIDQGRLNRLKDLGAPDIIIQNELAPVNCNYGIIIKSDLQSTIESFLNSLKLEYKIVDID